ncbi:Uncharacterised protein (plasmid) [Mycoplasmopsis canis]|uniref:Glycosyl hydrolase family 13 catalytic domain-containing protein n=1 Tax=Mycoplasmopsis canis TaxID=29555 RepID=A0A449ARZ5_9BACT|nr:hypothetical protein [Mycoplasmopsis canis]VEU69298.1 Uncharacterised protein [Mycoplasmopsis canis]
MQWTKGKNAGFNKNRTPWIKNGRNKEEINVFSALKENKVSFTSTKN